MENRRQVLVNELERTKERQVNNIAENRRLCDRIVEMEKKIASLELELKAMTSKYHQEVRAHQETEESRMGNREEASAEVVKALQAKLQEEKASKQRAENQWQERKRYRKETRGGPLGLNINMWCGHRWVNKRLGEIRI